MAGYTHTEAFDSGFLAVGSIHKIWYGQYGNPSGKSVLFLHGGPAAGTSIRSTVTFDPAVYRVVLLDQRGAGKSTPAYDIRENTSHLLVEDNETLRKHLGIDQWWMVFGGSWGTTLALLYAETHPESVGRLILRGISNGDPSIVEQIYQPWGLWNQLFPDRWHAYMEYIRKAVEAEGRSIDVANTDQVKREYLRLLSSEDTSVSIPAYRAWSAFAPAASTLAPSEDLPKTEAEELLGLARAKLEAHYFVHDLWLADCPLLDDKNLSKIRHIPCYMVQGRFDLICPFRTAWELHRALPKSTLYAIPDAGHSASEPSTRAKLIEICDALAKE